MSENNEYVKALSEIDPYEIEHDTISLEPTEEYESGVPRIRNQSPTDSRREVLTTSSDDIFDTYDTYGYNINVKGPKPASL